MLASLRQHALPAAAPMPAAPAAAAADARAADEAGAALLPLLNVAASLVKPHSNCYMLRCCAAWLHPWRSYP